MMIRTLLAIFFITSVVTTAIAQSGQKISGLLTDGQGKPMDYVTVSLLAAKDSAVIQGTLSSETGAYIFKGIKDGSYLIKATSVGYDKAVSAPFSVAGADVTVPTLTMQSISRSLGTVNVTASKPLVEHLADKTVVNVANSVLAAGNTAMDILERAPGVTVDKDDNISLKGKQGVTVMINDKLTYLSTTQLATLLRSTDGSTIQSIEIITNPSAKYDAAGNSGIINIKLKKNKQKGTNGSVTLGGSVGTYASDNTSINMNHKDGNLNVFGTFSHGDHTQARNMTINRTVVDSAKNATYFKQNAYMPNTWYYNEYNIGADYDISSKNTIGFSVNGYYDGDNSRNINATSIFSNPNAAADSSQNTYSVIHQSYTDFAVNLNDTYKIDTLGQQLSVDLDYSRFKNNSNANYNTYFNYPVASGLSQAPLFLRNQTPSVIDIRSAKIDYTVPLTKTLKLEAGGKFSDVKTDNDLEAQKQIDSTGQWINDTTRTNRFVYDEKISAAYLNLTRSFKNTTVEVGLRAEYTQSKGTLVESDTTNQRKYLDLFPSVFINHTFSEKHELGISYTRRIDRPDYDNLNPFVYYLDQYTYSQGNPFLRPQYTNNFELNYTYNKTFNVSLNYSHTYDAITELLLTNVARKATYETHLNLQSQDSYSIDINSPYTVSKWWTGNFEANAFYMGFKSDSLFGGMLNKGQFAYVLKATQTFTFSGFKAELFGNYRSSLTYGIYKIKPRYSVDFGISRSFANKKLNIKASVNDIFNTSRNDLDANYQQDIIQLRQKPTSRVANLTLTYNFGNSSIKAREHKTGAADEAKRVSGGN